MDEVIESHKDHIDEIIRLVYDKPYNYLFINTDSQRLLKKFDELTYENLKYVVETIKYEVEEEPEINNVIIFDDMGAYLCDPHVKKLLKELVMNRRHYHTSIFFLCKT